MGLAPPLPAQVTGRRIKRVDGTVEWAVTPRDAARLMGWGVTTVQAAMQNGRVEVAQDPAGDWWILVESLWALVKGKGDDEI